MKSPTPDTYYVAMKAFVRKGDEILICKDRYQQKWDLPGGRIAVGEFDMPLEEILKREIAEELGTDFRYKNKGPAAIFRHRRPEVTLEGKPEARILMVGFELEHLSGEITLSDEHDEYRWVPLVVAVELLPGGQQNGMEKYVEYLRSGKKQVVY